MSFNAEIQAGAPSTTPNYRVKFSLNESTGDLYYSKATGAPTDWVQVAADTGNSVDIGLAVALAIIFG